MATSLGAIVLVIIIVGFLLWLINANVPMQPQVKKIFNVVVIIVLVVWLIEVFGIWHYLANLHV